MCEHPSSTGRAAALRGRLSDRTSEPSVDLTHGARALWRDTSGLMAPYVTIMLPVIVGFSLLALDASRFMSLQTQMQAAADNLALAGARELNRQPGAESRAISAMTHAHASSKSANTTVGMNNPAPTLTFTHTFYSSLNAASTGIGGAAATGDGDANYVRVTVRPVTVPTIFPVTFLNELGVNSFSAGATAVAGFAGVTVCGAPPIFICNPWEGAATGNYRTDVSNATAALYNAFTSRSGLRVQFKLSRGSISPGHFGWLQVGGCNSASCMAPNIMNGATQTTQLCFNSAGVAVATGNNNPVEPYFDTRFDILPQGVGWSADNAPSVNVRKGYVPGATGGNVDWCNINTAGAGSSGLPWGGTSVTTGGPPSATNAYYTYPCVGTSAPCSGTTTNTSGTATNPNVTNIGNFTGIYDGEPVVTPGPSSIAMPASSEYSVQPNGYPGNGGSATTAWALSDAGAPPGAANGVTTYFEWTTAGLPEDTCFVTNSCTGDGGVEGNGQWDCADYWAINHSNAPSLPTSITMPDGTTVNGTCGTPATTTFSRYQIYRYEISQGTGANNTGGCSSNSTTGAVGDWSGNYETSCANATPGGNTWSTSGQSDSQGTPVTSGGLQMTESGYPYCAKASNVSGVDITTGGLDRRNIIAPFINCNAESQDAGGHITGAGAAQNVPVAAFGKFFLTQPYTALADGNLYGEVTGPVTGNDGVTIYQLSQLYR